MSSFTPKEIRGLYSAYAEVHMTEEDHFASSLLEEINSIINYMVDEGWDLSEYTWEELQESFLDDVILPEIERFNEVISQLNESTEELTEEQQEEFILEWGWLTALRGIGQAKKAADTAKVATKVKPSILQAPLVGAAKPASTAPLQAPTKPLKITRPLPSNLNVTGGTQQGGVVTGITNWVKGLFKAKPKPPAAPATAAKPATTTTATSAPAPTPKSTAPKPVGTRTSDVVYDKLKQGWGRLTAKGREPGPLNTPGGIKDRVLGTTKRGLATRLGVLGDVAGTIADPTKPSPTVAVGGGLAALTGLAMQGLAGAERYGNTGGEQRTSVGTSLKQGGEALTNIGVQGMTQPWRRGRSGRIDQKTGLPVYNSYKMEGEEELSEALAYDSKTKTWYDIDAKGNKVRVSPTQSAIDRYNELMKKKREAEAAVAKPDPKPDPKPAPAAPEPAKPAKPAPAKPAPAAPAPEPAKPAPAAPAPAKPKPRPLTPNQEYQKAAAAARNVQDPEARAKAMDSVRDAGMKIWADKYKNTLAPEVVRRQERATMLGRGDTQSGYPVIKKYVKPSVEKSAPTPTATPTAVNGNPKPLLKKGDPGYEAYIRRRYFYPTSNTGAGAPMDDIKDSYDVVLDYLLSEGHAETVEEAHYVMMQLDSEYIQSIVENVQASPVKLKPGSGLGGGVPVHEKGKEPPKHPPGGVKLPPV